MTMTVEIGKPMPPCSVPATSGLTFSPESAQGKKLVLYFYPKDMTPGCTAESGEFRDHIEAFTQANTLIVGVSRDTLKSHDNFRSKLELPFELVADTEEQLCMLFGVMKMKNMYGKQVRGVERSTFLFDSSGILVKEWRGLKVPGHVTEVLQAAQDTQ
jgi:peroxiredoxin Q/BCP